MPCPVSRYLRFRSCVASDPGCVDAPSGNQLSMFVNMFLDNGLQVFVHKCHSSRLVMGRVGGTVTGRDGTGRDGTGQRDGYGTGRDGGTRRRDGDGTGRDGDGTGRDR